MAKIFDLEDRTLEFAKRVVRLCKNLQNDTINKELISQLIRSSGSVGANYREANESLSKKDFIHRLKITRRETKESYYWLNLVLEANQNYGKDINPLLQESRELKSIFSSIIDKSQ